MREPTGLEHLTPVDIRDTSATERAGFRRCRRQWFLTTVHRLDPQEGNVNFFLGNCYHSALEAYYKAIAQGDSHARATTKGLDAYQKRYDTDIEVIRKQLGLTWPWAEPEWRAAGELGFEMAQNYFDKEELDPLFDEIVSVEVRVNVEIRDEGGNVVGHLSVQTDVVGRKDGMLGTADHKTASRMYSPAHIDIDDQLTAETFAVYLSSGEMPEYAIYNVGFKKSPHPPKHLKPSKDGKTKLSKAKDQGTTYELYVEEIKKEGLDYDDYKDILQYLKNLDAMGENVFFAREKSFRTLDQMKAFERDLFHEFMDMKEVAAEPERAYPNPTSDNCGRCSVRPICFAIQDGQDVETLIKNGYVIADPRR